MLPSFLCIGTQRAGTTWLHSILEKHPDMFLPKEKETMYFSHYYYRGITWYKEFFLKAQPNSIIGEICPTYLSNPNAPKRIYDSIPNVKIIAVLRNPVDQIYSLYKLWLMHGTTKKPLNKIIYKNYELIDNIMYYRKLRNYYKYFSEKDILVLYFDDLVENKNKLLEKIYRFLNVKIFFPVDINKRKNYSGKPMIKFVDYFIARAGNILRDNNFYKIKIFIKQLGLVDLSKRLNRSKKYDIKREKNIVYYIKKKSHNDIISLSQLTKTDLSRWL